MRNLKTITALAAGMLAVASAPAALAQTNAIGNAGTSPTMNVCVSMQSCTYVNYGNGKPTDVVKHSGTVADWSLNAGSVGGQVQLRVLRPTGGGHFRAIRSSVMRTVTSTGINTFPAHIKVQKGDVLALSNATSGIYMAIASAGTCVRYFDGPLSNGSSGKPNHIVPQLHLELSADVKS